jgi:membrane-associated protein
LARQLGRDAQCLDLRSRMSFLDYFLKLDEKLLEVIDVYGSWTYALLFVIIFCETGLVVTPILPGDSLLFAAGAFARAGSLDLTVLLVLLSVAAILGDAANYSIGRYLGPRALSGKSRFLKKEYLDRTHRFYERYGAKTIVLARFVPIVRTFAPFLAGVGAMNYWHFARYNVLGALLWIGACVLGGYFFGGIPFVRKHFELVALGIVFVSILPMLVEFGLSRRRRATRHHASE